MEIIYERVASIDVGKKIIAVAVRYPGRPARQALSADSQVQHLLRDADEMVTWLVDEGVTHVSMETKGVYCALCSAPCARRSGR